MQQKVFMLLALLFLTVQDTMQVESLKRIINLQTRPAQEIFYSRESSRHEVNSRIPYIVEAACTQAKYNGLVPNHIDPPVQSDTNTSKIIVFNQSNLHKGFTDGKLYKQEGDKSTIYVIAAHGKQFVVDAKHNVTDEVSVQIVEEGTLDVGKFTEAIQYAPYIFGTPFTALYDAKNYIQFTFEMRMNNGEKTSVVLNQFAGFVDYTFFAEFGNCIETVWIVSATLKQRSYTENIKTIVLGFVLVFVIYSSLGNFIGNIAKDMRDYISQRWNAKKERIEQLHGAALGTQEEVPDDTNPQRGNLHPAFASHIDPHQSNTGGAINLITKLTSTMPVQMQPILRDMHDAVVTAFAELSTKREPNIAPLLATVREFTAQIAHLDQPTLHRILHAIDASMDKAIHILHREIQSHSIHETTRSPA